MAKNIGIDLGFGFVKATNGEKDIIFPSVVGAGQDLTYRSELTTYVEPIENLAVTIDGKKYFVGDLAVRQSEIVSRSLGENHAQDKNTRVLLLATLALFVRGESDEFNVVTGLPPSYYLAYKDSLAEMIKGSHTIMLNTDGTDRKKNIIVHQVRIIPQPMGTMFNSIFDARGNLEDKELARNKVGISDVGFRTTDFTVVDKLEYIDKQSYSTTTGMSNAYAIVADYLRNKYRIYKENFELDEIVQKAQIKVAGKVESLEQIKKDAYEQVSAKILTEMNSIWDQRDLDIILLSGGGGKALADHILPELIAPNQLVESSQTANVHGYLKLAHKLFGLTVVPDNRPKFGNGNAAETGASAAGSGEAAATEATAGAEQSNSNAQAQPQQQSTPSRFANNRFFEDRKDRRA